ncbi:transposase (fragment) [Paraburkholderia ribeironis]|uniref:Transposase n=1 Tax=Paraburkholderia ribeironis TaxID=1247936 RepID=A0A1N7RSY0_9BURK
MLFQELTNEEWAQLSALFSDPPAARVNRRGRPCAQSRMVANAILWNLTTCEPWSKLPDRYPSKPTCRRRFTEWQVNGTLGEMVRLLTLNGRTFAYVPEPTPPVAALAVVAPTSRGNLARSVFWSSPETWQRGIQEAGETAGLRPLEPMTHITHQLALSAGTETCRIDTRAGAAVAQATLGAPEKNDSHNEPDGTIGRESVDKRPHAADGAPKDSEARDETAPASSQHMPLWMSLTTARDLQVEEHHGYVIYVVAERVRHGEFRACAEIAKDRERVERPGLIGPRFADADTAHRFALDWARQWIHRECALRIERCDDCGDFGASLPTLPTS